MGKGNHQNQGFIPCVLFTILCMFFGSGIYGTYNIVESFYDNRSPGIVRFDQAAGNWTSTYRSQFIADPTTVAVRLPSPTPTFTPLQISTFDSEPADQDSGAKQDSAPISTYVPYKWYSAQVTQDVSNQCTCSFFNPTCIPLTGTIDVSLNGNVIGSVNVPFISQNGYLCTGKSCSCDYGDVGPVAGYCYGYTAANSVCVKVDQYNGAWALDKLYGDYGCGDSVNWLPAQQTKIIYNYLSHNCGFPTLLNIPITVRSTHDPIVQFYSIEGEQYKPPVG